MVVQRTPASRLLSTRRQLVMYQALSPCQIGPMRATSSSSRRSVCQPAITRKLRRTTPLGPDLCESSTQRPRIAVQNAPNRKSNWWCRSTCMSHVPAAAAHAGRIDNALPYSWNLRCTGQNQIRTRRRCDLRCDFN